MKRYLWIESSALIIAEPDSRSAVKNSKTPSPSKTINVVVCNVIPLQNVEVHRQIIYLSIYLCEIGIDSLYFSKQVEVDQLDPTQLNIVSHPTTFSGTFEFDEEASAQSSFVQKHILKGKAMVREQKMLQLETLLGGV